MLYLLHFSNPYHHARHYLGFVEDPRTVDRRVQQHIKGQGSPLVAAAVAAGIQVVLAATMPGDRSEERRLKNWHKTRQFCPVCRTGKRRLTK